MVLRSISPFRSLPWFCIVLLAITLMNVSLGAAKGQGKAPPVTDSVSWIDELVRARWDEDPKSKIKPSPLASDGEFVRRAYLDIVGHVPPADKAKAYIASRDKEKKVKL